MTPSRVMLRYAAVAAARAHAKDAGRSKVRPAGELRSVGNEAATKKALMLSIEPIMIIDNKCH